MQRFSFLYIEEHLVQTVKHLADFVAIAIATSRFSSLAVDSNKKTIRSKAKIARVT